jgi:hypothetical protein
MGPLVRPGAEKEISGDVAQWESGLSAKQAVAHVRGRHSKIEQSVQFGPVAQLGERAIRKASRSQKSRSSNSTSRHSKIEQSVQFGPVAQLGERSVRIREVESSSLFRSTIKAVKSSISRLFYYFFEKFPGLRKSKISTQLKRGSARFASPFRLLKKQQKQSHKTPPPSRLM